MARRIVVVVGEPSGDNLGAQIAIALKQRNPNIEIEGVIGQKMISAGCLQLASMDTLSVMGLIEPLMHLPEILRLRKWLIRYVLEDPPDLFIGIDAPDINLGLERIFHKARITTVHCVSPSVWAWRQGRIKNIKKSVDLMLTLFPFEADFYTKHKVPVKFIGHPAADLIPLDLNIVKSGQTVAILPGSRNSELKHMTKVYLQTIKLCHAMRPDLKFVMPLVYHGHQQYIEYWKKKIIPNIDIKFVIGDSYTVMREADFALVTSGTATLEVMLHKIPMIVAFKTNFFTYKIVKFLIKVKYIALPNLLSNKQVIPEYIQHAATPENLSRALVELISSLELQHNQINQFNKLHLQLKQSASEKAADAIMELLC